MTAGYSGTPLPAKLVLREGERVLLVGAPRGFEARLEPSGARILRRARSEVDVVHVFASRRSRLRSALPRLLELVRDGGAIWVSWPKRASGVETDLTEDALRDELLPRGWVDVKVCAVDETWSALRFVRRRPAPLRPPRRPRARAGP